MTNYYTRRLWKKGQEREVLTKQLIALVDEVAGEIAKSVPVGTEIPTGGGLYRVVEYHSNIGSLKAVAVISYDDEREDERVFVDREPDSEYYLHGDFQCPVAVATRYQFLEFANNLPQIIADFEAEEDKIIQALRAGFEKLRALAESKEAL